MHPTIIHYLSTCDSTIINGATQQIFHVQDLFNDDNLYVTHTRHGEVKEWEAFSSHFTEEFEWIKGEVEGLKSEVRSLKRCIKEMKELKVLEINGIGIFSQLT